MTQGINVADCIMQDVSFSPVSVQDTFREVQQLAAYTALDFYSVLISLILNVCATLLVGWKAWSAASFLCFSNFCNKL